MTDLRERNRSDDLGQPSSRHKFDRADQRTSDRQRMLAPLRVTKKHEEDLALLRDTGAAALERVFEKLRQMASPALTIQELRDAIAEVLEPDTASVLAKQLASLGVLCRRRDVQPSDVVDALTRGLPWKEPEEQDQWERVRAPLERLLSLKFVHVLSKTLDLSTDYGNIIDSVRIITDIRPVFDEARDEIVASIVSNTMRVRYTNDEGRHSISLLLDKEDLENSETSARMR